jgi:hypothetical protein
MNGSFENSSIGGWRLSYAVLGFRQLRSWHGLPTMNIGKLCKVCGHSTVKNELGFPWNGGQYNKRFETDSPIVTVFGAP